MATASNGVEGLRAFEHEGADVLILDILVSEMDGLEVCRRVRRKSRVSGARAELSARAEGGAVFSAILPG